MSLSVGIVGLPNVGKSTLFTALTKNEVLIAKFEKVFDTKELVQKALETARQNGKIGKSLEAKLFITYKNLWSLPFGRDE